VLASQYSLPFLFDLQAGTSSELWIPRDVSLTLFGDLPPDVSTRDHPESGFLSFYSTSPDGTRIGVYYSITPNPVLPLGLRVIAFFGMDGRFLAATRLQFSDRLSSPAGAPAFPIYFIWTKDSAGVQVIHVERDPQGLLLPSSRAERIAATDATRSEVTLVPSRTTPTRGGPVSGNGSRFLPLADDLTVDVVPGWIAFEDVPLVPLDDVHYVIDPW